MKVKFNTLKVVDRSQFGNYYGSLELLTDGINMFLNLDDACSSSFHGPLTEDQVAAYYTLCTVKDAEFE